MTPAAAILSRVSYHAVYDDSILDALRFAKANCFAGVQIAAELPHLAPEHLSDADLAAIARFCADEDLRLSVHGPDYSVCMFQTDCHLRRGMWDYLGEMFDAAAQMQSRIVTLHLGQMPTFGTATTPRQVVPPHSIGALRTALRENLQRTVELAHGRFIVCMENFGLNDLAQEAVEPFLASGALALCWDIAKSYGDPHVEAFLHRHAKSVRQVHLHDIAGGRSHQVIGAGELPLARYLDRLALCEVLDYCIEVRPREKALESLEKLRRIVEPAACD